MVRNEDFGNPTGLLCFHCMTNFRNIVRIFSVRIVLRTIVAFFHDSSRVIGSLSDSLAIQPEVGQDSWTCARYGSFVPYEDDCKLGWSRDGFPQRSCHVRREVDIGDRAAANVAESRHECGDCLIPGRSWISCLVSTFQTCVTKVRSIYIHACLFLAKPSLLHSTNTMEMVFSGLTLT